MSVTCFNFNFVPTVDVKLKQHFLNKKVAPANSCLKALKMIVTSKLSLFHLGYGFYFIDYHDYCVSNFTMFMRIFVKHSDFFFSTQPRQI